MFVPKEILNTRRKIENMEELYIMLSLDLKNEIIRRLDSDWVIQLTIYKRSILDLLECYYRSNLISFLNRDIEHVNFIISNFVCLYIDLDILDVVTEIAKQDIEALTFYWIPDEYKAYLTLNSAAA